MSIPYKHEYFGAVRAASPTFGVQRELATEEQARSLLALSHTTVEHRLYEAMLKEVTAAETRVGTFSVRRLMTLTRLRSYSTVRRGLSGLINKLSIEHQKVAGGNGSAQQPEAVYLIFKPEEIFARRLAAGLKPYPQEVQTYKDNMAFGLAMERVVERHDLSRREAHVALCCAEGLTNAEIGEKLYISEQTVKFHLRHIFVKFGVKRRAELVARLLTQRGSEEMRLENISGP